MSINHRSEEFMAISKKTITLLREKLVIPKNHKVYFVSSATECWEIIAQSVVEKESIHLHNGAFGEKWSAYTQKLPTIKNIQRISFDREKTLNPDELIFKTGDVVCITQNETANGTQVSNKIIRSVKRNNPNHLVAVDATSSMGGIALNFKVADIWFASVQKCFGLPAGLAIMICSPQALERAQSLNRKNHYNSLLFLDDMMQKWQTPCTPNVLTIYLLMRVMEQVNPIEAVDKAIKSRYKKWEAFFDSKGERLKFLIQNKAVRSHTVLAIQASPAWLDKVKLKSKKAGFLLGEGYGALNSTTFRIANFPAIQRKEIARLIDFLYDFI